MESRILGDYNIIKQIGHGALGNVYLAEHRFMKKQYVLKVLPQELSADRAFIQRFEEEVAKLVSLDHPNIVKVHNISYANGYYFIVTDCVVDSLGETTNLAQYMLSRGRRLEEDELFRILQQVAEALDYAHSKKGGIVHAGIKLNNLLVSKGEKGIDLKISDFSLARIIGVSALLTRAFSAMAESLEISSAERYCTPPACEDKLTLLHASFIQNFIFLAPEQKCPEHPMALASSIDNYAFGVLAYYLIMGDFPEGYFEMPSTRVPQYKMNWDALMISCLRGNPEERCDSLVAALEQVKVKAIAPPAGVPIKETPVSAKATITEPSLQKSHPTAEAFITSTQTTAKEEELEEEGVLVLAQHAQLSESKTLKPVLHVAQLERPVTDLDPALALQVDPTVTQYVMPNKDEEMRQVKPILTDMIIIDGGPFQRGSVDGNRDEMPQHQINVDSFALDVHPVTNEQFVRFLEALGGEKDSNHQDVIRLKDSRVKRSGGKVSIESGYSKHPVVGVTWYGAVAYARWVGKRLPTEAEWEVAAKGGEASALFPSGNDIEKSEANFFSSDTTPVMSYPPNKIGLFDMAGNVYEWCQDWYGYNFYESSVQEPDNPKGPLQGVYRVLRGGCWKSLKEDLRCSRRHRNNPGTVNGTYGFRCAADVQ